MKIVKEILKTVTSDRKSVLLFIIFSLILTALYYVALLQSAPFIVFVRSNSLLFVILQIVFSLANAIIGAISIVQLIKLYQIQREIGGGNILQSTVSLFFSVATTGCYVCGSVLLPSISIAASFAAMPFGGLEIKILTLLLLIYSVLDLNKKLNGNCEIIKSKILNIKMGNFSQEFNVKFLYQLKPTLITLSFITLIYLLPSILPAVLPYRMNDPDRYACVEHPK